MEIPMKEVLEKYYLSVKRYINNHVAQPYDAEDILQDVFLKIQRNIGCLKDQRVIRVWIFRIAQNAVRDYYRSHKNTLLLSGIGEELFPVRKEPICDNQELACCVKKLVKNLPDKDRKAIVLTGVYELSQKELALNWGLSFSGAKSRVQRARKKVRQQLSKCCDLEYDCLGNIIDIHRKDTDFKLC